MPFIDYLNPYAYAMRIRRIAYKRGWLSSYHPGIPVISVGNLTLGGTGKSPVVLLIADYLEKKRGKQVAIVSRGYKRRSKGYILVRDGKKIMASVEESGDEAQMLAEALSNAIVIVDEDRVHGAREAKSLGADVIILDDGFQHLRIKRDLNILLMRKPSAVIPFGRAREPESASGDADFLVFRDIKDSKDGSDKPYANIRNIPAALSSLQIPLVPLTELNGKRALALSSIAAPKRFHEMLRSLGANVVPHPLGDHAEYSESLVKRIIAEAENKGLEVIVTTAKDIVKSRKYFERAVSAISVYVLHQKLEFLDGEERFYSAIDSIL